VGYTDISQWYIDDIACKRKQLASLGCTTLKNHPFNCACHCSRFGTDPWRCQQSAQPRAQKTLDDDWIYCFWCQKKSGFLLLLMISDDIWWSGEIWSWGQDIARFTEDACCLRQQPILPGRSKRMEIRKDYEYVPYCSMKICDLSLTSINSDVKLDIC
jgi:hypothetical protein